MVWARFYNIDVSIGLWGSAPSIGRIGIIRTIRTLKKSGFCHGVSEAVRRVDKLECAYMYGDLVNNENVMAGYRNRGFTVAESVDEITPGATVVIRAHGVPRDVYVKLESKNVKIVDCTCKMVKRVHDIVHEKSTAGYRVIIIGKNGHPEVTGIFGWCKEGSVIIAESEPDLEGITTESRICVVGQTTCKKTWWNRAVEIIKTAVPEAEIFDTLCNATAGRIADAVEIAKASDVMVVVGDRKSANSLELNEACKAVCKLVLFVSNLEELLEHEDFPDTDSGAAIGIAGSASAPAAVVDGIYGFLLFSNFLAVSKIEIEAEGERYFNNMLQNASSPGGKDFIAKAIRDLAVQHRDGKRIRGAMIRLGAKIADLDTPPPEVALAYELFQTSILIHDDIIDKSPMRRGRSTIHSLEKDAHFGISRAVCVGDYGLFLANKILADTELPPEILVKVFKLFSKIQLLTIEGEIMDVTLPYTPIDISRQYEEFTRTVGCIFEYKTAWYTLVGPIMLGAICGGADEALLNLLRDITMPLGIAFQMKDDLLGIYADEKILGKSALSDIIEKKQTLLYGFAYKSAGPRERRLLDASYGNANADADDLETVRKIFISTGAKEYSVNEIRRLSDISLDLIKKLPEEFRDIMQGLVHYLITRKF